MATPTDPRSRGSRLLLVIVASVVAVQLLIFGVVYGVTRASTADELRDQMFDSLGHVAHSVEQTTTAFLGPAQDETAFYADLVAHGGLDVRDDEALAALLVASLRAHRGHDGAFVGRPDGSFVYVNRAPDRGPDALRLKVIATAPTRSVTLRWIDGSGAVVDEVSDPDDDYDPRTRPWYERASESPGTAVWTDPYIFFTSQRPGLTAARTLSAAGGATVGVVGVDISLSELSEVLASSPVSERGEAFLLDAEGRVLAYPDPDALAFDAGEGELEAIRAGQLDDPLLQGASDAAAVASLVPGRSTDLSFVADGVDAGAVVLPLEVGRGLLVGVAAPEDDFVGDLRDVLTDVARQALLINGLVLLALYPVLAWVTRRVLGLRRRAETDPLTGLANRRAVDASLERSISEAASGAVPLCLAVIDLDRFKDVNDEHGHPAGDAAMRAVAQRLRSSVRDGRDLVARAGGDELHALLRCDLVEASAIAERMRRSVAEEMVDAGTARFAVTVSIGLAEWTPGDTAEDLVRRADRAAYDAKATGRDRVVVAGAPLPVE